MSRRNVCTVKAALCVSAFLLLTSPILAGDRVHSPQRPAVSAPVVRTVAHATTYSVNVKSADPSKAPTMVTLRGPDGTVRRFPLEGDVVVLSSPVVVRPGKTLTIWWVAAK
jgi:hypothetical protein